MIIRCFLSCLVLSCIRYLYIPQRVYANHDLSVFPVLRILFSVDQATLFYLNGIGDVPFCQIQAYWHRKKKDTSRSPQSANNNKWHIKHSTVHTPITRVGGVSRGNRRQTLALPEQAEIISVP